MQISEAIRLNKSGCFAHEGPSSSAFFHERKKFKKFRGFGIARIPSCLVRVVVRTMINRPMVRASYDEQPHQTGPQGLGANMVMVTQLTGHRARGCEEKTAAEFRLKAKARQKCWN